jgi:succinyl-CoA synthetase beta subunit
MLTNEMSEILAAGRRDGWINEPESKRFLSLAGLPVPRFRWCRSADEAVDFMQEIGPPVVAKVVSPAIVHKSDAGGVTVGIRDGDEMAEVYRRYESMQRFEGVLVEETVSGIELILGAKNDLQFGPVVLLGIGGTGVEIYHDTTLRMAPITKLDARSMIERLKGNQLLKGYRGARPVDTEVLTNMMVRFSEWVVALETQFESVDLNPVKCNGDRCLIADARIMLAQD